MSPSNHHHHHQPVLARTNKHRTLCDLPVELLSIIVSHIKHDGWTLRSCTHTCPCMRAVAIEHLFSTRLSVTEIVSFDHLLSFLQANPAVCNKIRRLFLSGQTRQNKDDLSVPLTKLDATVVARFLQRLPNLVSLRLRCFIYSLPPRAAPASSSHTQEHTPSPFHLEFLSFSSSFYSLSSSVHGARHHKSSISGLFRILSLFSIDELDAGQSIGEFKPSAPLDPKVLHRPLSIKNLQLSGRECSDSKCPPLLINAFAESIAPRGLQSLTTRCCSMATISAIGKLLARGGADLTSLDIGADAPYAESERGKWKNPLDNHWHRLDLTSCPKLESLVIYIYFRPPGSTSKPSNVPVLSLAGTGMLSQTSQTLRRVRICLYDLPRVTTLNNRRMLRLQEFDKVLAADQFPNLKEVSMEVHPEYALRKRQRYKWQHIVGGVQRALPGLHARGLLAVREWY